MSGFPSRTRLGAGFSLVELLVVISVIGMIVAIVLPSFSGVRDQAQFAKDQRNAQSIASVVSEAVAAGYHGTNWSSLSDVISSVSGSSISVPAQSGAAPMVFAISELSEADTNNLYKFLTFVPPATVLYNPSGDNLASD
ncbi:hypothetical protein BH09VER1_BH09VER1_37340 [soil metagenome]